MLDDNLTTGHFEVAGDTLAGVVSNCTMEGLLWGSERNHFFLGLDTLCRHNFGHNAIVRASSIMPA